MQGFTSYPQTFAHGSNTVDGEPCPAMAAGYNPDHDPANTPVELYDQIVHDHFTLAGEGTISADRAREAWALVIEQLETDVDDAFDERDRRDAKIHLNVARAIARDLGWGDIA